MRASGARLIMAVGVVIVVVAAVTVLVRRGDGADLPATPVPAPTAATVPSGATDDGSEEPGVTTTTTTNRPSGGVVDTPRGSTLIATLAGDIPKHASPDGDAIGTVPGTWHERPRVLPVIDQRSGWLHVRLPERPNGSTAWIRRSDVELATTPYRIEVDVATLRLRLFDAGELVVEAPAGIGTDDAPTPVGHYFVAFLQEPPDTTSGWGPFVVVTSAHSETISDFQQFGDAITAIHGPLGSADRIGTTGAKVSHGCVRLHLEDLALLRDVPAGSPVDIVDSSRVSGT